MKGKVVLASGLWMPAAATAFIAARLARAGYATRSFAYQGRQPFEANVERFTTFMQENHDGRAAHFVGHSLGGVLIYEMLERHRDIAVGRVVLLGAPVRGCQAGRRLGSWAIGRWMLGGCAPRLEPRDAVWRRPEALGVIAATVPLGLGRALGALPGENDGVVCVAETELEGMADRALVRTAHSTLAFSAHVARLIEQFLSTGRFS